MAEVDPEGLDKQDRRYLETLVGVFEGGPTGVEALAATMNLPTDTLSDDVEPYLLREQFIVRTPRGRIATLKSYALLGKRPKTTPPPDGIAHVWNFSVFGSKRTTVFGFTPDSLYQITSRIDVMPYGSDFGPLGDGHSFTAPVFGSSRPR